MSGVRFAEAFPNCRRQLGGVFSSQLVIAPQAMFASSPNPPRRHQGTGWPLNKVRHVRLMCLALCILVDALAVALSISLTSSPPPSSFLSTFTLFRRFFTLFFLLPFRTFVPVLLLCSSHFPPLSPLGATTPLPALNGAHSLVGTVGPIESPSQLNYSQKRFAPSDPFSHLSPTRTRLLCFILRPTRPSPIFVSCGDPLRLVRLCWIYA